MCAGQRIRLEQIGLFRPSERSHPHPSRRLLDVLRLMWISRFPRGCQLVKLSALYWFRLTDCRHKNTVNGVSDILNFHLLYLFATHLSVCGGNSLMSCLFQSRPRLIGILHRTLVFTGKLMSSLMTVRTVHSLLGCRFDCRPVVRVSQWNDSLKIKIILTETRKAFYGLSVRRGCVPSKWNPGIYHLHPLHFSAGLSGFLLFPEFQSIRLKSAPQGDSGSLDGLREMNLQNYHISLLQIGGEEPIIGIYT